jgi:hypothetical protein
MTALNVESIRGDWALQSTKQRKTIERLFVHAGHVAYDCRVCGKTVNVSLDPASGRVISSNLMRHWKTQHLELMKVRPGRAPPGGRPARARRQLATPQTHV